MPTIIGIDPGSTNTGIAIIKAELNTGTISSITADTITPARLYQALQYSNVTMSGMNSDDRIKLINQEVGYMCYINEPVVVAIESPFYNRRFPGAFAVLQNQMTELIKQLQISIPYCPIVTYAPMEVKRAVGAKVRGGKDAVTAALVEFGFHNVIPEFEQCSEHAIDATAVAYCAITKYLA